MFKTDTQHAFRALVAMAQHNEITILGGIAERSNVPPPMLAKVLHRLVQGDLVKGQPGPRGGYRLARPAEQILLRDVTSLMEGPRFGAFCLFGLPACTDETPCPLHEFWGGIRRQILAALDQHTIADLAEGRVAIPLGTGTRESPPGITQKSSGGKR